jgi:hypothetical protein
VYKKGDILDCKNYRGICQLNVAYKVFAKVLHSRLLPEANAVLQHYAARYQSRKSTTDQFFALLQLVSGKKQRIQHHNSSTLHRLQGSIRHDNKKWNLCNKGGARFPYQTNTFNLSNADNCQVLRQNTERLFERRFINAAFQSAKHLQQVYADGINIVGSSWEALRDAHLALEAEAAEVGKKINEQ